MKNVLPVSALMMSITFATPLAKADSQGVFVSLGAGRSSFNINSFLTPARSGLYHGFDKVVDDRRSRSFDVLAGYRWNVTPSIGLGVEGGYASLGTATAKNSGTFELPAQSYVFSTYAHRREKVQAALIGLNARWELPYHWELIAHGGVARYRTTFTASYQDTINGVAADPVRAKYRHENDNYYVGLGIGYAVTTRLGVMAAYDVFSPESSKTVNAQRTYETVRVRTVGVKMEYRF
jgi:OOP family OmpA-OmpF porin/outer membrane immunogenic protein